MLNYQFGTQCTSYAENEGMIECFSFITIITPQRTLGLCPGCHDEQKYAYNVWLPDLEISPHRVIRVCCFVDLWCLYVLHCCLHLVPDSVVHLASLFEFFREISATLNTLEPKLVETVGRSTPIENCIRDAVGECKINLVLLVILARKYKVCMFHYVCS